VAEPDPRTRWIVPAAIAAGLVGLVVWSTWQRYAYLASSPYPMGIDGYFYPIQLRSLLEHGTLQYPASPLAFWLMAPLAWATDPITGAKLGAALGGALIALPAYAVGARLGGRVGGRAAGLAAAAIATTSAGSWYLSVEFVKNGWGLTAALTAVWLILRAVERPSWPRLAGAALGTVAAALTHKMAVGLVVVVAGPAIASDLVRRGAALTRARLIRIAAVGGAVVVAAVVVAIAFPERFIAGRDLGQLGGLFQGEPLWTAPALHLDGGTFELTMGHEAAIAGLAALLAAAALVLARVYRARSWWRGVDRPPPATAAAIGAIALAVLVALPWLDVTDPQGLGFRLRIAAFVPLALVAAVVVGQVAAFGAVELARLRGWRGPVAGPVVAAALAVAVVAYAPSERTEGVVKSHPAMVAAVMALEGAIPAGDTVVVSERHILYMAAYYTRAPIVLRPEPVPAARRWRLMPLAFIGKKTSLYRLLLSARATPGLDPPRGFHPRDANGLVLVPEATWQWILERLPPGPQRHYREWHTI